MKINWNVLHQNDQVVVRAGVVVDRDNGACVLQLCFSDRPWASFGIKPQEVEAFIDDLENTWGSRR